MPACMIGQICVGFVQTGRNKINHNRKGGTFEIEQPEVGPEGEPSGSERVKGHGEHGGGMERQQFVRIAEDAHSRCKGGSRRTNGTATARHPYLGERSALPRGG